MNMLAALRHSPFLLAALSARAEGRTLRCARLSAALAAHGVAIVDDMGLSVSGQRGEWAALSVAVCVHKKKGARCAPGDANLLFADFVGFVADADEVDAAAERRSVDYGAAFLCRGGGHYCAGEVIHVDVGLCALNDDVAIDEFDR